MSEAPEIDPRRRKLAARRFNENLKLLANSVNTVSLTAFGAAFLLPSVGGLELRGTSWIVLAAGLHLVAHIVLRFLRSED